MESHNMQNINHQQRKTIELDIKVLIREDLKKGLIFGLEARLPIGIILGYFAYRHQVMPLM